MILLGNILMNCVVRKASQGKIPAGKKNLDLVSRRKLPDAIEDVRGLVFAQHRFEFLCDSVSLC